MSWRVARSLLVLRDQLDAAYPGRSRASDGTIGDAAHQASVSDHNPDDDVDGDGRGEGPTVDDIVRALDVTHDPAHGCDIGALSDQLAASRDERISYVIANRMITGPDYDWEWAPYDGDDPHTGHLHLSVVADGRADDTRPWQTGPGGNTVGTLDGIDPYDRTTPQAAELRNTYHLLLAGYQPDGSSPSGVVARLDRIERAAAALAARPGLVLSEDQLAAIGGAAAAQAAGILGDRMELLERQVQLLLDAVGAAARAAGGQQ